MPPVLQEKQRMEPPLDGGDEDCETHEGGGPSSNVAEKGGSFTNRSHDLTLSQPPLLLQHLCDAFLPLRVGAWPSGPCERSWYLQNSIHDSIKKTASLTHGDSAWPQEAGGEERWISLSLYAPAVVDTPDGVLSHEKGRFMPLSSNLGDHSGKGRPGAQLGISTPSVRLWVGRRGGGPPCVWRRWIRPVMPSIRALDFTLPAIFSLCPSFAPKSRAGNGLLPSPCSFPVP